ncbi:MAG TPA: anthranilate phosphoribosyltransferase [Steroidobacteraceae bacterium]|nr:anthranilate phosphoribosyltransferase [Steroidobacteraceae bacterium]
MSALRSALERLLERRHLTQPEACELLGELIRPETSAAMAGAVLAALRAKGVVAAEVRGLAEGMRAHARRPQLPEGLRAIDVVGTGGDGSGSLNISTGTALLVAACGIPVVKHGNRSVSSRAGSADVLEALGVPVPLDEQAAPACLAAARFTFLFAPYYHPAMKALAPVRSALGVRTVFNLLGPLTNPALPPLYVIGAPRLEEAQLIAETLCGMPIERAFVVHGAQGWDEPTPVGPFTLFDVRAGEIHSGTRSAAQYGLPSCGASQLAGGDARHNAAALRAVLTGEDRGPHRDCLLLGAALALEVAGVADSPATAVAHAARAIDSGAAAAVLAALTGFASAFAPQGAS